MKAKRLISPQRKTLHLIMLLGVFLSTFGAGNLPSVAAQNDTTYIATSNITVDLPYVSEQVVVIPNGKEPNQIEIFPGREEQLPTGPNAVSLDMTGNVYIGDQLNHHVLVIGADGQIVNNIFYDSSVSVTDLTVMNQHLFLLDISNEKVHEYTLTGAAVKDFSFPYFEQLNRITTEMSGRLSITGLLKASDISIQANQPFIETSVSVNAGDSDTTTLDLTPVVGIGTSRGTFSVVLQKNTSTNGIVKIENNTEIYRLVVNAVSHSELGSVSLLDFDNLGNVYILVTSLISNNAGAVIADSQVVKYDPQGNLLSTIDIPDTGYTYASNGIAVDANGNIYQILTELSATHLIRWTQYPKGKTVDLSQLSLSSDPNTASLASDLGGACTYEPLSSTAINNDDVTALSITRDQVISNAEAYRSHTWTVGPNNYSSRTCSNGCPVGPSHWSIGTQVTGVAYQWGGYDTISSFDSKLSQGYLAGDVSGTSCVGSCATGVDCSGFVSRAWETSRYTTSTLPSVSTQIARSELKKGDILDNISSHVVLFSYFDSSGAPVYYEAAYGSPSKVWLNTTGGWNYVSGYTPYRYNNITDSGGGSAPTTPSSPNPSDSTTVGRTTSVNLSWSTTGTSCDVSISGGPGTNINQNGVGCSSFTFGQQWPGSYLWHVTAHNSYGTATGSTWHFYIRPYAPSNLSASTASQSQINLSWTKSGDDPGSVDSYNIYRNGTNIANVGAGSTSYQATGLSCNTNYSFYVKAVRQGVESDASNTTNSTTSSCGSAPTTPSNPNPSDNATLGRTTNINLSWSTTGTSCDVSISGGPGTNINQNGVSCSSFAFGQQWPGSYQWHVTAHNSYGTVTGSTWHINVQPYAPSNLNASTVSQTQINLTWIKSGDDPGSIDSYNVYNSNGSLITNVGAGSTSYQVNSLSCNTNYSFYVKAVRQGVESAASNTTNSTTSSCGSAPSTPSNPNPSDNSTLGRTTSINLSWSTTGTSCDVSISGGPGININQNGVSCSSFFFGQQWPGSYQWHVIAHNSYGTATGPTWHFNIQPYAPSNLNASAASQSQINLTWTKSGDDPGSVDNYNVYNSIGSLLDSTSAGSTSYQVGSLSCNSSYSFYIKAVRQGIESAASNTVTASTSGCPSDAPSNLIVASSTSSSITLSWQDNSNNETGFKIYRWGYDGTDWNFIYLDTVSANVTTYTQTGIDCGIDFNYYEVSSYNGNGESDHAGWVQGTTSACPPSDLTVTDIRVSPISPFTNDDVWIEVDITNSSNVDAPGFWTDFYVDDVPTGCKDWGTYFGWSNGLAANTTFTWFTRLPASSLVAGTHQFRAFVDSGCVVSETSENNNISTAAAFTLNVPTTAAPPHDDFNSARLISPVPYTDIVNVSGATTASDDPYVSDCGGYGLVPGMTSVWYKYTPSINTRISLDTLGSSYDTYIAVWSGARGNLTSVACNDDYDLAGDIYQSMLSINLTAGTTYYFEVAEYSDSYLSSLSTASILESNSRSLAGTPLTESARNLKAKADLNEEAGGTLQFHAIASGGADTTGVFRPSNGLLYLKNLNTTGFADIAINYGIASDYPAVGDWDGNGTATIGIYRNGSFYLRNSNTLGFADLVFLFGQVGDQPIAGDWNGDGIDTIGIFRPSTGLFMLRNSNDAGPADAGSFFLGNPGDVGIAGDWTGKGYDTVGVFRPVNGIIFLKNTNQTGFADIALNYGISGDRPVTGDWNDDGKDTIGVYRNGQFLLRNSNTNGFADISFGLGNPGDMPIAGNWDGSNP